jgi:PAS domain S-box-containing protein
MSREPLLVLLFEDNPDDARLFRELLHEDGLDQVELVHVDRLITGLEHLTQAKPDIILLDLGLPDSQGLETFTQVYAHAQDVPIVVLTGPNDSEQAVESVKAGAQDYLVKGEVNGGLLARAIRYAIERKRAKEALAASEGELRTLFKGMMDVVIVYDAEGCYVKIAPTNPANLYLPSVEMLGKTVHEVLPKEQADYIVSQIREALQSGRTVNSEYALSIGGKQVWFTATATRLTENTVIWVAHDITYLKQAEAEIRRRLTDLEVLYASGLAFGQSLQPQEIGQKVIEILSERLQWHHATLRRYHPESETLELLAFHQPGLENEAERQTVGERFRSMIRKPGQGLVGWVIEHGQPVYCGDVTKDGRYLELCPGIRSGMYVPLKAGERTIGCLSVESEKSNAFSQTDEWLITTLATQAASALENARLYEETSRRLQRVQALRTVDTAISSSLDLHVTIDVFLNQVMRQLGVDAADVLRLNPHTQTLEYVTGRGFRTTALQHTCLRLGEGYAGQAGLEQRLIQVPDLRRGKTGYLRSPNFSAEGFETGYCVPLMAKSQLQGVLEIFHRSPLEVDQEWIEFLETLAGQAAIAIDNISLFDGLQRSNLEQSLAYEATIEGWSRALDLRDKETEGHTQRVTEITLKLANAMNMPDDKIIHIRRGALLHDIGKMGIPDGILLKPGPLSDEEWEVMRKHPRYAYDMLSPIAYLRPALDIPYCHHEKWDGSGYPQGLKGEQIPLAARIFALVDVYDALTSDRPYRPAWTKKRALEHIRGQSGAHFDPAIVEAFLQLIQTLE